MPDYTISLVNDCPVTVIPAGDPFTLPAGATLELVQSLGGSFTVKSGGILYRIDAGDAGNIDPESIASLGTTMDSTSASSDDPFSEELLWGALKECYDPEIPINIVDLGLIYDLSHTETSDGKFDISAKMTLTAQGCGMGPVIAEDAKRKLEALACVNSAEVDIVWDPPWNPHMISEEGRTKLGIS